MVTRKKKSLHVSFDDLVLVFEETGQHSWILRASTGNLPGAVDTCTVRNAESDGNLPEAVEKRTVRNFGSLGNLPDVVDSHMEASGQVAFDHVTDLEDEEEVVENFDFEEDVLEYGDDSMLDFLVRELVGQCTCPVQFPMVKVGEGKYKIGDSQTLIFVRVLRNHVMVRVGGGWDTLEHYLNKHDPCRCHFAGHRSGAAGPRHQIIRRASTSNIVAQRSLPPAPSGTPTSPRRMSSAVAPASSYNSTTSGAGPTPGSGASSFTKGPSPIRSASPTLGVGTSNGGMTIRRLPSPAASSQQQQGRMSPSASFSSRPPGLPRSHSPSPGPGQQPQRQSHDSSLQTQGQCNNDLHQQRQALQRQLSDYHLQQQQQQQNQQQQQQQPRPVTPQHQAVQRCKSPSPGAGTRCVSPALSGNRTLPRPVSRGPSGIPRPQSPAPGAPSARRQLNMNRSVSFDGPTSPTSTDPTSRSADDLDTMADTECAQGHGQGQVQGDDKSDISIDQISTMTLSEFKKLINSSLSVPTPGESGVTDSSSAQDSSINNAHSNGQRGPTGQMRRSNSSDQQSNLSWSSVRDKARSVCNSIQSQVSARRPSGAAGIIARRNLPRSPASDANRPKPPSGAGADRPKTPSAADRPKTPVSTYRPKTPTSAYAYRPKTPTANGGGGGGEEGGTGGGYGRPKTPSRPKTPTAIGTSTPKTYNSYSTNSRDTEPVAAVSRPKTPTSIAPRVKTTSMVSSADSNAQSRPKTPTNGASVPRVKNTSFVYNEESDSVSTDNAVTPTSGMGARTASWTSSTSMDSEVMGGGWGSRSLTLPLSRRSQSPADDLDGDNDEIAEAMNGGEGQSGGGGSLRERPPTPSRIPKPCFTPRPASPPSSEASSSASRSAGVASTGRTPRVLPRPSTPVKQMSGDNERPPPSPRRQRRSATPGASGKSYMDMYQQRRAATPGPTSTSSSTLQSARPTTPGPGTSSSGLKAQQQFAGGRRGSLSRTVDLGQLRKAKSVTSLVPDSGGLSLAGGRETSGDGTSSRPRGGSLTQRAQTTDSQRRLQIQNACDGDTEGDVVLMVSRGRDGHHSVSVTDHNENVTYSSAGRSTSGKTAQGRLQQSASFDRPRSKTPGPGVSPGFRARGVEPRGIISRKHSVPSAAGQRAGNAQNKPVNRTEAWVDSTLNDPKRKQLPPRPKRAMTPNSLSVHESELMSRPLEEIQAVLPSPEACLPVPDPECLEAPPEDPEMYRKMEQLFEKYREMELRASVCDTPGGGGGGGGARQDYDTSSNGVSRSSSSNAVGGLGSSGGGGSSSRLHRNSVSSRSTTSLRTSLTTTSGSVSSGVSSARSRDGDSSRGTSVENDRFSKESSPAAAAATPPSYYSNGAASFNYSSDQHHNLPGDDSACVLPVSPTYEGHVNGAPAVSAEDIVDDIPVDPELIASNPTALVSKIKEILKVRPRKEDPGKTGTRSRIPAPAPLSRSTRSKSMSNLSSSNSHLHLSPTTPDSAYTDSTLSPYYDHTFNGNGDVTRDESTNSDVSSELSRCETPVPKLAQPLTTGRSTLFRRERSSGALRAMSQDDRVSTSSSQSSSSRRYWDEEGEYV